jgi:hypothetical protein
MKPIPMFVFALLLILFPAQLLPQTPKTKTGTTGNTTSPMSSTELGRYRIIFSPHARADTFLVDTLSGKVWQLTKYVEFVGDPIVWTYMDRLDDFRQMLQWESNQIDKSTVSDKKSEFKFE